MKKVFIALFAGMVFFYISCNETKHEAGGMSEQQQKNIEASRTVVKAFETGDVSMIDSVIAEDFVDHTDRGDKIGRDSLKAMVNFVRANFKDMKVETISETADKDYVFHWLRYTGTSDGTGGMPAGPYDLRVMEISRFRDGKAVEHWGYMDVVEAMKMYGQQQPADTTKNK